MDKAQEEYNDTQAEEESGRYTWLAGAFVGGFLIIMIIVIIGIVVWRYIKNQNTSNDQNWAGPSPLAYGNIHEEGNCMNSSILGRSLSISQISTTPIIANGYQTAEEDYAMSGEMQHGGFQEEETNRNIFTVSTNLPNIPAAPAENECLGSDTKMSREDTEYGLHDETFPPPPHEISMDLSLPPPPSGLPDQDFTDNHLQPPPEMNSFPQDGEEPLNLQISHINDHDIISNLDLLPPPPPEV